MMVNFICQMARALDPVIWSNILDVSVKHFLDEINI